MTQTVIENPILNSPFEEPQRHFKFTEDGITDTIVASRRTSSYFVPIPRPKKKSPKQIAFETEWTADRVEENKFINQVREKVALWRKGGYVGITRTTARLLEYWKNPERDHPLFFCQIEALETVIYVTEVAGKYGGQWIENKLRAANESSNPLLNRIAFKMATGSGKTVVMAMMIAWHTLNKSASPQDARFSDAFLIVTPGITIRDRLRVLLPNDPNNYYREHDIVPPDMTADLGRAKIVITNFQGLMLRERIQAGKVTRGILRQEKENPFQESPGQMVRRVCRELGNKKNIIVINDEAHHCYRRKPESEEEEKLVGDERREAQKREEEARVWISGLEAVKEKIGIRAVYDLSATPFFLSGSGYSEGTLFPWVVSDFSLIDAIESGIVKVPRVPVADDSMAHALPTYRHIWPLIRDNLPKKGRAKEEHKGEPKIPAELEGALRSLYGNYEKYYRLWEGNAQARERDLTPPVFIVVCNNTNVSNIVYKFISGWEKQVGKDRTALVPGKFELFNNVDGNQWKPRPNTILIDSEQLESGEGMSQEFKKIAAQEIEEFKNEYRLRFPGRSAEALTDEDLLREVMNTVGKPGRLGEHVRCVVSVSMLTEGWDATTVTHILGVRAFGTQLLCEQVVGRGLRRMSYGLQKHTLTVDGATVEFEGYAPEYAEVYGVPFSFIPCAGATPEAHPGPAPTRVRALEDRIVCEITFPRVIGYRCEIPSERLEAKFTPDSLMALTTADVPTKTEVQSIIGEREMHTIYGLRDRREQEIDFYISKLLLEEHLLDDEGARKPWLFPQLIPIVRRWRAECLTLKDDTFPQMLLMSQPAHTAADKIYRAIAMAPGVERILKPILRPYDTTGSTRYVDFDTIRPVYPTDPAKCHISHVVADTSFWEQKGAATLEDMEEVRCYVKNQGLGFFIPYVLDGVEHNYQPDFIARIDDGHGVDDLLSLVVEVSGEARKDKAAKTATMRSLWIPAVNNHGGFGRWAFIEITDPWDAKNAIRAILNKEKEGEV
jgi:type III restriction enzyme